MKTWSAILLAALFLVGYGCASDKKQVAGKSIDCSQPENKNHEKCKGKGGGDSTIELTYYCSLFPRQATMRIVSEDEVWIGDRFDPEEGTIQDQLLEAGFAREDIDNELEAMIIEGNYAASWLRLKRWGSVPSKEPWEDLRMGNWAFDGVILVDENGDETVLSKEESLEKGIYGNIEIKEVHQIIGKDEMMLRTEMKLTEDQRFRRCEVVSPYDIGEVTDEKEFEINIEGADHEFVVTVAQPAEGR